MTRAIWHFAALCTFYALPIHSATIVARAVVRLSERGEGDVRWVAPYYRLAAGLYDVVFTSDGETMNVLHILRARR